MPSVLSVNLGAPRASLPGNSRITGIDKRPTTRAVPVSAPGPKGTAGSGLAGDAVLNLRHHGGDDQAVYAYAREDLDAWQQLLGRELPSGSFGENLTTQGLEVSAARIGERWQIGDSLVLQVTAPRIPCATFAGWLGERGWVRRFSERAVPGTYLRVLSAGPVQAGDTLTVMQRPEHDVSVGLLFRAVTREPELLPRLLEADEYLLPDVRRLVQRRAVFDLDDDGKA